MANTPVLAWDKTESAVPTRPYNNNVPAEVRLSATNEGHHSAAVKPKLLNYSGEGKGPLKIQSMLQMEKHETALLQYIKGKIKIK